MTDPLEQRFIRQTTIYSDLTARIEATALQLLTRRIRTRYPQAKALILTPSDQGDHYDASAILSQHTTPTLHDDAAFYDWALDQLDPILTWIPTASWALDPYQGDYLHWL